MAGLLNLFPEFAEGVNDWLTANTIYAGTKRAYSLLTPPTTPTDTKRPRLIVNISKQHMAFTKRRRSFGRRKFRGKGRRPRRRGMKRRSRPSTVFKKRVRRVILRTLETAKKHYTETSFTLAPGNGTTGMNVRVFAPWQSAFTQGTGSGQMTGSKAHPWKFIWRLNIKGLIAGDVHVQILYIKSDFQMDVTAAGTDVNNEGQTMSPTTTTTTVPTQVAPNGNIPLFDVTAAPGQFAGLSPVTKYNTDNFKIIKKWDFKLHGFGVATTDPFLDTSLTFPINKPVQIQETQETIDGIPRFFGSSGRRGSNDQYYILMRTWQQDFISATATIDVDHRGLFMWKDI